MTTTRIIVSDDHSHHDLPIGATVTPCGPPSDMPYADDADWYTQGIDGDERAIDPRDLADPGYGHRIVGADFDGHNGYVRGIVYDDSNQQYVAISATFSHRYKTLAGAVRRMGRYGYDAYGERLPEEPR